MSRIGGLYRRFNPSDAVMLGGLMLEDLMLYSFATKDLTEGWDIATDKRSGGRSDGSITWHPWDKEPKGDGDLDAQPWPGSVGEPPKAAPRGHLQSQSALRGDEEKTVPPLAEGGFLRFSGELSLVKSPTATRAGFCGTRPAHRRAPLDISDYAGVEMRIRTDGRLYELNVTPRSIIPDDMYQGHIQTPPGVWGTVAFPLNRLTLTGRGQVREYQRALERAALHSIGFSVADGLAGPFQLDVAWISAVQEVDGADEDKDEPPRKIPPRPENGVLEW